MLHMHGTVYACSIFSLVCRCVAVLQRHPQCVLCITESLYFMQTSFLSLHVPDKVGFASGTSQPWFMPPSLIQLQPGRSGFIYLERFVPSKSDLINLKMIWWWRCRTTSEQKYKQNGTWMADMSVRGKVWIIKLLWYFSLDLIINLHFKIYGFRPTLNLCREDWWGEKEIFFFCCWHEASLWELYSTYTVCIHINLCR